MDQQQEPQSRTTPWRTVILVCRKCGKRQHGGFGPKRRDDLRSELRQALRDAGRRRDVRVFEAGCFGICPKRGVTALNATLPGNIHIIPAGTDPGVALDVLLGGRQAETE
jgi:predicted metal-binding protein